MSEKFLSEEKRTTKEEYIRSSQFRSNGTKKVSVIF